MANKFKYTINPKLCFKNEKDRKILIATKELEGSE